MVTSARSRADLMRQAALWAQFESIMTNRALVRLAGAGGWIGLAIGEKNGMWWFGTPMLVGALTALMHARKRLLDRLFDAADRRSRTLGRALRVAFPFPAKPHVIELPGYLEAVGLVMLAVPTGWIGAQFGFEAFDDPVAAVAATALVLIVASTFFVNLAAHPTYAMDDVPSAYVAAQWAGVVGSGVAGPLFLWPALDDSALRLSVVVGSVFMCGCVLRAVFHMINTRSAVEQTNVAVEHAILNDLRADLHTGLKNPAHAMINNVRAWERAERRLKNPDLTVEQEVVSRDRLLRASREVNHAATVVATRVSAYVELVDAHETELSMSASEAANAVVRLYDSGTARRLAGSVVEQIDPTELSATDNERAANWLSELFTNAIVAKAESVEIRFRWEPLYLEGDAVELSVRCTCGAQVQEGRPAGGTLGMLADRVEQIRGTLRVVDHGSGSHSTVIRWPVDRIRRKS